MVIIVPTEITFGAALLIMLPYFAAVIATIIYTNKETRKSEVGPGDSNKSKEIAGNNK